LTSLGMLRRFCLVLPSNLLLPLSFFPASVSLLWDSPFTRSTPHPSSGFHPFCLKRCITLSLPDDWQVHLPPERCAPFRYIVRALCLLYAFLLYAHYRTMLPLLAPPSDVMTHLTAHLEIGVFDQAPSLLLYLGLCHPSLREVVGQNALVDRPAYAGSLCFSGMILFSNDLLFFFSSLRLKVSSNICSASSRPS